MKNISKVFKKATVGVLTAAMCVTSLPVSSFAGTPAERTDESIVYFVDCGDYVVSTVNEGEQFGTHNSVTDQVYGEDAVTGYTWGIVDGEELANLSGNAGYNANPKADEGEGIATANTWSLENLTVNADHATTSTFRYSKNAFEKGYDERYVQYAFELEKGSYEVTVGFSNLWGCADSPVATASVSGNDVVLTADDFAIADGQTAETTGKVVVAENGEMVVDVRGTGGDNLCAQVTYILIKSVEEGETEDQAKVRRDKEALTLVETARTDIELPTTGANGTTITWESDNTDVIDNDGNVTRPAAGSEDAVVTLTATITSGDASDTKEFTVTVPAEIASTGGFEGSNVLNLAFEDDLTDSSASATAVTVNGTATYVDGVVENTKAMSFNGSTWLDMGTNGDLSPENLTVSFWIKPSAAMTGEQIITWNKNEWYTDGWYLSSENDSTPLSFSIGPAAANQQPYMVTVANAARSEFFPVGEWTNIVVTYNNDTKEAKIYRNGVSQATSIKYGMSGTSTGVIGPCETTKKIIGSNGPSHGHGSKLNSIALDEYRLYNTTATAADVVGLYEEGGGVIDKKAVAEDDLAAISLPTSVAGNISLPTEGVGGSTITWSSANEDVITTTGKVTRPAEGEPSVSVKLTASVSFAGGEAVTKDFFVTVKAEGDNGDSVKDIRLDEVDLEDAYLVNATQKEYDYLLSLNSNKFLYMFYKTAGLTPRTTERYEGWERESGDTFRGHMFGHYMSGLAMSYQSADDPETKAALFTQIEDAVSGLKECQDAYAAAHPKSAGFIAPFKEGRLDFFDGSNFSGQGSSVDSNVYVPWYNLHKVLAGLIDVYTFVDDEELAQEALGVAESFGVYVYNRCNSLSDNTKMLGTEYGGMNEALYELYDITGNTKIKEAAQCFDEVTLFKSLANNQDVLSGKHANTTIPKLTGALKRYTVMMNNEEYYAELTQKEKDELEMYKTAAVNFWDIVVEHHTYITGGNSQSEHFHGADKMYADAEGSVDDYNGSTTCETCNTYNMLKLSRELYKLTKDKKYMDYYENTYLNAIVSSQNPETGTTMYFQPMAPGYNKVFNRPYDEFWCCTGTGVENFSKLGDTYYFVENSDIYVNMYFANTYTNADKNLVLDMDANMPNEDDVTVTVKALDENAPVAEGTRLKFRIPDWTAGEATILVNDEEQEITDDNGYAVIENIKDGDVIKLTFPMEVVAYSTQDNENFIAFKYGPVVLSAGLGTSNIEASNPNGILVRVGTRDTSCQTVIIVNTPTVDEWRANIAENLVRIEDSEDGQVQFVLKNTDSSDLIYTPHFMRYKERYGLYMTFEVPDSASAQERIKTKKEMLRDEEITIDSLYSFDANNSEAAKNVQSSDDSTTGSYNGRTFRSAKADGWFSYDMAVDPEAEANYLVSTYTTADAGRSFDLYINGDKQKTVTITNEAGSNVFYEDIYEIPEEYWKDGGKITVKYQSNGGLVGGLYGIAIRNSAGYNTDPRLEDLSFQGGTLKPEYSKDVNAYNLIVPTDTESVTMSVSANTASNLVYYNDILIDDTLDRVIALTGDTSTIQLKVFAQDHKTSTAYTITVIRADGEVDTTDQDAANAVMSKINNIGTIEVTDECKAKIEAARAAYEALTEAQKALVTNLDILVKAEAKIEDLEPRKVAEFTFDDVESGFTSEYAVANNAGTPSLADDAVAGKSLRLNGSSNWLSVTDVAGGSLLTGFEEITISYWSKINNGNANWAFYAAPDENAQTYQFEKYLGSLENGSTILTERYNNSGARVSSAETAMTRNVWKHVVVVFDADKTIIYVDGVKKAEQASTYALADILGENSILYFGKANWESGEYFNGWLDEISIYNYALSDDEAEALHTYYEDEDAKAAVDNVIALIDAIGTVSDESGAAIAAARAAYEALTDEQKLMVSNYNVLTSAEEVYEEIAKDPAEPNAPSGPNAPSTPTTPSKPTTPVVQKVTSIKLSGISKQVAAGKKITLEAAVSPANAANKDVVWTTSNKKWATVSAKGVVKTNKAGIGKTVTITATAKDGSGVKASYKIKIMKHAVKSVKITTKTKSVKAGKKLTLKTKVTTTGKSVNKKLVWSSSNTKYATVNSKGVVKTTKAGKGKTVKITVKSTDGTNKKATIKIKIK